MDNVKAEGSVIAMLRQGMDEIVRNLQIVFVRDIQEALSAALVKPGE